MRHSKFQIFQLDDLSSSIAYLWTAVNYALNLTTYWVKLNTMPINSGVECFGVPSDRVYCSKFNYSRILAYVKMPSEFWHENSK